MPNKLLYSNKVDINLVMFCEFWDKYTLQKNFLEHPVIIVKKCGVQKILLAKKQEFYVVVSGLWHTCFTPISNTWKFQEKQNV